MTQTLASLIPESMSGGPEIGKLPRVPVLLPVSKESHGPIVEWKGQAELPDPGRQAERHRKEKEFSMFWRGELGNHVRSQNGVARPGGQGSLVSGV